MGRADCPACAESIPEAVEPQGPDDPGVDLGERFTCPACGASLVVYDIDLAANGRSMAYGIALYVETTGCPYGRRCTPQAPCSACTDS